MEGNLSTSALLMIKIEEDENRILSSMPSFHYIGRVTRVYRIFHIRYLSQNLISSNDT